MISQQVVSYHFFRDLASLIGPFQSVDLFRPTTGARAVVFLVAMLSGEISLYVIISLPRDLDKFPEILRENLIGHETAWTHHLSVEEE
jgi:hypothetical protein